MESNFIYSLRQFCGKHETGHPRLPAAARLRQIAAMRPAIRAASQLALCTAPRSANRAALRFQSAPNQCNAQRASNDAKVPACGASVGGIATAHLAPRTRDLATRQSGSCGPSYDDTGRRSRGNRRCRPRSRYRRRPWWPGCASAHAGRANTPYRSPHPA